MDLVVGTAGHVDHGKSTLVHALTGIDPDRLAEEKRRGMTIELGFAPWRLPSGKLVGVVDVPGHRRLVRTMVAGAHGFDLVLLVVAANEGVMPQTREHLAICELLGMRRGVVALTKSDLVDEVTSAVARAEVEDILRDGPLDEAQMVLCSATTGQGLAELARAVDNALDALPERSRTRPARLYIDRAFSMPGFGPVVTGTLEHGALSVGEDVNLLPGNGRARIRGLQRHGASVESVTPGSRAAVNLAGIERQGLRRGMAVVPRDAMVPSTRLDCLLRVLPATETGVRHRSSLEFHTGTAEAIATVSLITEDELRPGHAGYAQLNLDRPIPVLPFDRFVLRRASLLATVGGGTVLDIAPRRHRRRDRDALAALERRQMGGSEAMVREELRKERLGIDAQTLRKRTGLIESALEAALSALDGSALRVGALWFARERWEELRTQAVTVVREFHVAEPLRQGIPREEWSNHLRLRSHATAVANALVEIGDLVEHGPFLALPDHQPALSKTENEAIDQALKLLAQRGIDAPSPEELASLGLNRDVMHLLAQQGRIVRLPGGITLAAETYTWAKNAVEQYLRAHQAATVAQLRDHLGATRRVVVPLLEQLDASGVTVRNGDTRRLRAPVLTQSRH